MLEAVMFWNEPNNKSHWDFENHDDNWMIFSDKVRLAGSAVHAENPALPRGLGGMSPIDPYFVMRMRDQGVLEAVDVIGVHGFPLDWNNWQIDESPLRVEEIQQLTDL